MTTVSNALEQRAQNQPPTLAAVVQRMQPELARALPKHMDADRMARLALTVLRQTPKLAKTSPESFCGALLTAAALGLEPGVNGEAYLVPHGTECTLIVGYAGFVKLFWQHPMARHIDTQTVFENDDFDYAYGLEPYLRHKPARGDRGAVIYYYAVATLNTGATAFEVMTPEEVKKVRGGKVGTSGVPDPQHWMERKTVLKQMLKMLPKSTTIVNAMSVDEHTGTELASHKIPDQINATGPVAEIEAPADVPANVDPVTGEVLDAELEPEGGWPSVATPGGAA